MLPMPANQQRTQQQRLQQLPPPKAAHPQQQLQLPTNKGKRPLEQSAAGPAAAPAGGSGRQEGQLQWPRRQPAGGSPGPAAPPGAALVRQPRRRHPGSEWGELLTPGMLWLPCSSAQIQSPAVLQNAVSEAKARLIDANYQYYSND